MNWTTASMESCDNQAQIRCTNINKLTVQEGILSYESITVGYKHNFDCYNVLSLFLRSSPHGGSLTLYSSLGAILILHLLIIWSFTWVSISSNTFSSFLWVVVAKTALFKGLLNINATRKVVAMHLIRW